MCSEKSIGQQVKEARERLGLSQSELAGRCRLNIRTIQRIEHKEVKPRLYTLRILDEVLNAGLIGDEDDKMEQEELISLQKEFERKRRIRMGLFIAFVANLAFALIMILSNVPKVVFAPFVYLIAFAIIIGIGVVWRCPGCNGLLGDLFNSNYCPKCGLRLKE
ncbi:MAG: hypothetical protein C0593_09445 [Marinilabiliales bacterium]|nr:MAG: hypothetical protein C0593_09445 [Marinilabiliales bacterium]